MREREAKTKTCSYDSTLAQGGWVKALCIGVDEYKHLSELGNCVRDATAIAQKVQELPGRSAAVGPVQEPQCKNPASKHSLQKVLKTFLAGIVNAPPRVVLVYFAGHGIRTGDKIFLVPANATLEEGTDLKQWCMSLDEVWELLKTELEDKIHVGDVLFLVILDTCQNLPYKLKKSLTEESFEPDVRVRPKLWALCTAAARGQEAEDGDTGGHSPFNSELLSPQCGLFEQNVSIEHALNLVCGRLRARGQEPHVFNMNNLEAHLKSICLYGPERLISEQHDVFICFREDEKGCVEHLAHTLQARLMNEDIRRGGESRKLRVFLKPQPGRGLIKHQVADALCSSQVVILLVSHITWKGVGRMRKNSLSDDPLAQLLARYEMILELHEQGRVCVLPLLIGSESGAGRLPFYQDFDEFDDGHMSSFWPIQEVPKDLRVESVVKSALDGLRSEFQVAQGLHDKELKVGAPSILRSPDGQIVNAGRSVWQTLEAYRRKDHFSTLKIVGEVNDAVNKVIREVIELIGPLGKRAILSDGPEAATAFKMPRTDDDGEGASMALGKRGGSTFGDAGEGSSSNAKKPKQDSTSASAPGGAVAGSFGEAGQGGRVGLRGGGSGGDGGAVVDHGPPWDSIRGAYEYDIFISHAWDEDDEGRDNHARAKRLNEGLQKLKVKTWFDDEQMQGNILQRMAEGIERSAVVLICVTRKYMDKVKMPGRSNCKLEFEYAYQKRTQLCMLPVVMEESMTDTAAWDGVLGMVLGTHLYCELTSDIDADFDCAVTKIAESVDKMVQMALPNEMQSAASAMSSRSHSPAPTDMSYVSTAPATPQSPQSQEVLAMHVENPVHDFRVDMKKLIEGFLKPPRSEAAEQPALRQFRLSELLLVAFMKDQIAPCPDDEIAENLEVWQEKCDDPAANLITAFSKLMLSLKPSVLNDIGYDFAESSRPNHTSIFAIDWMVQHSKSALPRAKKDEWDEEVVLDWFVSGNAERADGFLERAEKFLQKGVKGESWGAKILGNVIKTNSYVIFFRMGALAALLIREHCALQTKQHTQRQMQQDLLEPATCAPSLPPISLVVSSSNWHWSSAEGNDISAPHKADITARLRCIASLPCQLLEANTRPLSQMKDVGCELLYSLKKIEAKHVEKMGFSWEPEGGWDASFSKILSMLDSEPSQKILSCSEPLKASASMIISDIEKKIGQGEYSSRPEEFHSDALRVFHAQLFHDEAREFGQRQMQESGALGGHGGMADVQGLCENIWKEMQALLGCGIVSTPAAAGGACIEDVKTERGQREKRAKDIFHRDRTSRDLIYMYMQSLVQDRHGQKRAFSVGKYIDSASGEEHQVDGTETISVVLVPGASFNQQADEVEEDLKCPISRSIMRDPVTCSNGKTYDREWIEKWARVRRNPNDPLTREPLECKETADGPRLQLSRNDGVRVRIEAFKRQKLAELERQKQSAEGEEERRMLRSRYGLKMFEGMVLKDSGDTANAKTIDSASDFLEFLTAGSASGLACLIGPPASGKTVTMQQVVYAAVIKCKDKMEQQGSVPLLPVFMRAAVLSSLISENEATVGCPKVVELRQLLELFLTHGVQQGIFPTAIEKCILDLYDLDCILICIDGLDEAAAHQEFVEISIEHAVKSAADSQRRVHVLLSTREHSYIHSRACLRLGDFDVVDLQPLNQARQKQMVQGRIQSAEVDAFWQQLAAIAGRNHELVASPFLLSLMIEVYLKEGKIPSRRVELYEKQVHAMVKRCMQERDNEGDILDRLEVVARFLETLAFVCQIRLATRDFMLDECASDVKELWRDGDAALTKAQQLLFTPPVVGLLADVGGKRYRFNHLTLQEYLAAKCALRLFECAGARTLLEHLRQGEALFSRWKREVLQFIACMLREETFPEFCQVLLEMDDCSGVCCELVQDFLKERGPSEAVERMLRDQVQKIRGTDLLLSGLCHPCPEMRSLVLSEMIQFRVPPNPFANETVPKLKEIAEDTRFVWHKRAAAMLSLAQIAQMKHCSRSDRAETIRWMLKMLQLRSDMLENVHFALVKALGTMLESGGESAASSGIMLQRDDESVIFQPGLRESVAVANALADLKIYSAGLVDWLEAEPSLIAHGRWPIIHVHFLCENAAALTDFHRALGLVNSLLHRLHSSSFQMSEQALLLRGLRAVHALLAAVHALVADDGWRQVLPFLESGDAEQRARVLAAAVDIKVRFEGEDATGRLARCLLLEMGPTRAHGRSETSLLSYVLNKEAEKYRYSSLRERSDVFVFLVNIMGQSTGDSQQAVSRYLIDFEKAHVWEKSAKSKADEKPKQGGEKPAKGEEEKEEQGDSGVRAALVKSKSQQESDEPRLLTTNASSIDRHLQAFLPGILDQEDSVTAMDVCERYCAASLWTSSGLVQEAQAEKIARWLVLREDEPARVAETFADLKHLQEPWMQGREGTDGKWERQVREALQLEKLGGFIFAMLLSYIREKVVKEPSRALEGFKLLSDIIRQWDAETDEKRLERQFLLKELCIGRRNEHLPSWSGDVTQIRTQQVREHFSAGQGGNEQAEQLPRGDSEQLPHHPVRWGNLRVAGLCIGVDDYQHMGQLQNAVRDAETVNRALRRMVGCYSEAIHNPKTATELRHQLRTHLQKPDLAKEPPELFVVYYAGHGFLQHGKMWLVPAHAHIRDPDEDLPHECLSLNDLLEMLRRHLDQPVQNQFGAGRAVVFLVVLDACRVQLARGDFSFDGLQALEPDAKEAPRKYKILFSCSRKTTASDGPSGGHSPFAAAMCDVNVGLFAEGVALRDAIESVSRAVQSSAGGQAPTVLGRPDALPSDFCINPRSAGTVAGRRKKREADEELLAVLRETGLEKERDWLAEHGVRCVEDVESLREEDLAELGLRFRKLFDHVKSCRAQADAFLSTMNALARGGQVSAIIEGMVKYPRHENVQKRGCGALCSLAVDADNQVKVAAEGGIGAILGAMLRHPESADLQEAGCRALWSLAVNDDNEVKVAAEGGIGAILGAMLRHPGSAKLQAAGCEALRNLSANADNKVTVAAEGGIGAILGAMQGHPGSAKVQEAGCGTLCNLAFNADNQVKVAAEGGIGAILGAMRRHPGSAKVQVAGCGALRDLAFNADNQIKVAAEGGIGAILGAMQGHPKSSGMQEAGCGALWSLICPRNPSVNADNKVKVAAEGGTDAILGALRGHPGSAKVQAAGCGALTTLATGPGTSGALLQIIKSAGAEDAVTRAMALINESMKEMGQMLLDTLKDI